MKILKDNFKRLAAVLLCAAVLLGAFPLTPGLLPTAKAASWATPYVDQLQQWGIMQGVGNGEMNEGGTLTRAGMVAMLNRAFGFTRTSPIPFTDVRRQDWFYDDVVTSYAEGIVNGTSASTFSPKDPVTREQALVFLARCLRLEESPGEITEFTDGRQFSSWAAPYVRSAMLAGIISGGTDGSFQPGRSITRGEMAKMLATGLGNLINVSGTYSEGGVFGNLTINTRGVTLKDTTIAGDLYLTGGVGLGDVVLDNVKVLGRIVVAGGGESEDGEASILLNNVEAHKMLIDPATGQYVSIRAIGSTDIPETQVTSNSYIQDDVRIPTKGLREVFLNADEGTQFTVAGNMKDVINQTPGSTLVVGDTGDGSVSSITVDEKAVNSTLQVEINAAIDEVNLDTATKVTGSGDIGNLVVNTNGSVIDILPDRVVVRPGVITEIAGIPDVDSEKAKELSDNPRLLEGFPKVRNVAPTSADAVFSTNKAGTLYWALTTAAVGPLNDRYAESLISPSYGSGFLASGSMPIATSKTEYTASLTDLAEGGTYYISAMLVDAHGRRSPVKAQEIITPDGSVPAFAKDFPTITDRTPSRNSLNAERPYFELVDVQATVMATKSCDLYYVLLPSGSSEPSTAEFLSHAFVDPLGYGRLRLIKNAMDSFKVNQVDMDLDGASERLGELEESTEYDLYVWLTDADGTQSSDITKVTFTTKDITPPKFNMDTMQTGTQATSVRLTNSINEDGTVYWVALPAGTQYPMDKDNAASEEDNLLYHQMQIINGTTGTEKGKSGKVTAKKDAEFNISITGLERESEYDVYFVAVDAAGNASGVQKFIAHTLDESPPVPRQEFTSYPEDSPETPYANSEIRVIFNETIRYRQPTNSSHKFKTPVIHEMYDTMTSTDPTVTDEDKATAKADLLAALRDMIVLYDATANKPVPVKGDAGADEDWVINYDNVVIYREENGELVVSFPYSEIADESASRLLSGGKYFFQLKNIADNSERHNALATTALPTFTVVSAEANLASPNSNELFMYAYTTGDDGELAIDDEHKITYDNNGEESDKIPLDMYFTVTPRSTHNAADSICWDMLLWFDTTCEFELYTRVKGEEYWTPVGGQQHTFRLTRNTGVNMGGVSIANSLTAQGDNPFTDINDPYKTSGLHCGLEDNDDVYEYGVFFTSIGGNNDRNTFSEYVNGRVTVVTGSAGSLLDLARRPSLTTIDNNEAGITNISKPAVFEIGRQFVDGRAPDIIEPYPVFDTTTRGVNMQVFANRPGEIFYLIARAADTSNNGSVSTSDLMPMEYDKDNNDKLVPVSEDKLGRIKTSGQQNMANTLTTAPNAPGTTPGSEGDLHFDYPYVTTVVDPSRIPNDNIKYSTTGIEIGLTNTRIPVEGLTPDTDYYVYFVTKGVTDVYSDVLVYKFRTPEVVKPIITIDAMNADAEISSTQDNTNLIYKLIPYNDQMDPILRQPFCSAGFDHHVDKEAMQEFGYFGGSGNKVVSSQKLDSAGKPMEFDNPNFTVLDALLENIMSGGRSTGSLFDFCASETLRNSIINYIQRSGDTASIGQDTGYIETSSQRLPVACDEKWPQIAGTVIDYCLIVMGYCGDGTTVGEQSNYAFTAAQPISVPKERIKMYWDASGLTYSWTTPPDADGKNGVATVTGALTIYFTDALHSYDVSPTGTPTRSPIYLKKGAMDSSSIENYITIPNAKMKLDIPQTSPTSPLRSLTIDFDEASGAMTVRLRDNMYAGSSSDPQSTGFNISVNRERALNPTNPNDSCGVIVTATPSGWIATDRM